MKLLMLSTDKNVFNSDSAVAKRLLEYGDFFDYLDVIIYTKASDGFSVTKLNDKITLHPTRTKFKPFYFFDAYKLGKSIIRNCLASPDLAKREKLSGFARSRVAREIGNCVITSQDPFEAALVGVLLKRKFHLPLQIQIHSDPLSQYFAKESLKNRIRVVLAKIMLPKGDGWRVVSNRVKQSILSHFPAISESKIVVLPISVDPGRISAQPVKTDLRKKYPDRFIILSASRFTIEKNVGMALRAMRQVVKQIPKAILLLVGSGPDLASLKLLVKSFKLKESVVFEPWTDDLISYYKTADIFLMTSNYEGGARAPAEAVVAGAPVIMTDVAPAGEVVRDGENGYVVPVGDADILAQRIVDLLTNQQLSHKFQVASRKIATTLISRAEYTKRYVAAIKDLL